MSSNPFTIGIVCSGNTCRSPIARAWLRHLLARENLTSRVQIWTAGLRLTPGESPEVPDQAQTVGKEFGLSEPIRNELQVHRRGALADEHTKTQLLVWIKDAGKVNERDEDDGPTRAEILRQKADELGATLLVIPEPDDAFEIREEYKGKNPESTKVVAAYRTQSIAILRWMDIVWRFVPK